MRKPVTILLVLAMALGAVPAIADEGEKPSPKTKAELPYVEPRSPLLAGTLSIVPGLGQVYNEQYGLGALYFITSTGLYLAAMAYTGVFDSESSPHLNYEALFLFAIAGGIHVLAIFDATLEAARVNENLERWSVMVDPGDGGFSVAYTMRF